MADIQLVKLRRRHLRSLAAYEHAVALVVDDEAACRRLCRGPIAYAALSGQTVIAAGGVVDIWPGRGAAWFLAGKIDWRHWPTITALVIAGIEEAVGRGFERIECSVMEGHDAGHRWARRLGFQLESFAPKYLPFGRNAFVYAIVT